MHKSYVENSSYITFHLPIVLHGFGEEGKESMRDCWEERLPWREFLRDEVVSGLKGILGNNVKTY